MIWLPIAGLVLLLIAAWLDCTRPVPRVTTCERCGGEFDPHHSSAWSLARFCSAYCEGDDGDDDRTLYRGMA